MFSNMDMHISNVYWAEYHLAEVGWIFILDHSTLTIIKLACGSAQLNLLNCLFYNPDEWEKRTFNSVPQAE